MQRFSTLCGLLLFVLNAAVSHATDIVTVVDENQRPIANATILLGYEAGKPFPGNLLTTNASGTAAIPADWKAALPVTVQAPGYITSTLPVATPGMLAIQLTHQESANEIEVKGTTDGYGTLDDESRANFGLVVPALSRSDLLSFDMSSVVSPKSDTISVMGQSEQIPSNLALPDQTVSYIIPIEINKPDYRTYVRKSGKYTMSVIHGSIPVQQVVNDVRAGKSIFDMINYLTITEGGQRSVNVTGDVAGVDLTVNQVQFNNSFAVKAPSFPSNEVMINLALSEQNGSLLASDVKRLNAGQSMNLQSSGKNPTLLSLLMVNSSSMIETVGAFVMDMFAPLNAIEAYLHANGYEPLISQSFNQLSFSLIPAKGGAAPQFLPLINPPTLDATNVLKMSVPAIPSGLTPVATYMVLSEIQDLQNGKMTIEQRTRLWEVWSTAWLQQVELPKVAFTRNPNRKYRWEVMFLAAPAGVKARTPNANGVDLNSVTHVTRNTLEI